MQHQLKNFESLQIKARREKKKGRPKESMAMAFNKNLMIRNINMEKVTDEVMKMEMDMGSETMIVISMYI